MNTLKKKVKKGVNLTKIKRKIINGHLYTFFLLINTLLLVFILPYFTFRQKKQHNVVKLILLP